MAAGKLDATKQGGSATDPEVLRLPQAARAIAARVLATTDESCLAHLDHEYAELGGRMIGKLARKRPSPYSTVKGPSAMSTLA
jgi:hypothetical protein